MYRTQIWYYSHSFLLGTSSAENTHFNICHTPFSSQSARNTSETQLLHAFKQRIMFMRYLSLAILASTALSQSAPDQPTATKWLVISVTSTGTLSRKMDTPASPLTTRTRKEVIFKYNFTGTLSDRKFLGVTLLPERLRLGP
jgi:hypothetical protein